MISNFDIEDFCKARQYNLIGVFSKNELPPKVKSGFYVINLADSDEEGTHWTCFYANTRNKAHALYFDSFATPPPKEVVEFLKPFRNIIYNNVQVQANTSVCCGFFCIAFIKYVTEHKDAIGFLKMFHHDKYLRRNERVLLKYLKS